jgi:hypothetical protein
MPLDLLPNTFACAPIGHRLSQRLGPYRGYAQAGSPHRPLFSLEQARRIAEDWNALPAPRQLVPQETLAGGGGSVETSGQTGYYAHFNSIDKTFRFYDPEAATWYTWSGEEAGIATLYPIGEGAWRWECGS